jgi:hypothetical protein
MLAGDFASGKERCNRVAALQGLMPQEALFHRMNF